MATKRKICEIESESEVNVEKKRAALGVERKEDRLSDLPEALQLRILSCLDTKQAVQTMLLSKYWVNLWTRNPVVDFNPSSFNDTSVFEPFVEGVLHRDRLDKLDRLKYDGHEICSPKTLKKVFDYAFSHDVKQLEARFYNYDSSYQPVSVSNSLTSLKLQAAGFDGTSLRFPFLGLGSKSLKNLTVLYLENALITDDEPFSGFPVLNSLTLHNCDFGIENKTVIRVYVHTLRDLTIVFCTDMKYWELRTPRLRFLEYGGSYLPKHEGLPVLETLKMDFRGISVRRYKEKPLNDDLMSLFSTIPNVKSVTLLTATVLLLSLFPDELVRRGSPFRELKDLTLYIGDDILPSFCNKSSKYESVKAYLLCNSPDAKLTIIRPTDFDYYELEPWCYY